MKTKSHLLHALPSFVGLLSLLSGAFLAPFNHYLLGLLLILSAVFSYCFIAVMNDRNWLDIRAVFSGTWLGTIGLASFRLLGYQEQWQPKTWVLVALAYLVFIVGASIGDHIGKTHIQSALSRLRNFHIGRLHFQLQNNRLFAICIITSLIGLITFIINVWVRGYIPCFSSDPHAYTNFYSKVQIFSVAATAVSGLCYYVIRTQNLSVFKKILLYFCILYHTFAYPILIVSRGTFLASAISLMVMIFYLHKKRFIALLLSIVVIFSVYVGCSFLRNYTSAQLISFFEPSDITLPDSSDPDDIFGDSSGDLTFSLPPYVAWIYSYLTVSHDNFNEAVQNNEEFTYGSRQMAPLNVVLRIDAINEQNQTAKTYRVREHLNTNNLIGDFYYDFGVLGVALCLLFWALLFGINQGCSAHRNHWVWLLLLGNTLVPVVLCFFAPWTSVFSQWMLWGVVLIFLLAAGITWQPKRLCK